MDIEILPIINLFMIILFQLTAYGVPGAAGMTVPQHVEGAQRSGQDL